jgi:hypothetical protein
MIKVRHLLVRSIQPYSFELSWEIEPTTEDPLDYTFQIYRSESQGGPFASITSTFEDKYYFIDNVLPEDRKWRNFYYAIEVVRKSDSKEEWSDIRSVGDPRNPYAQEISRIQRSAFAVAAGTRVYVFPIKTFGQWCSCFDPVTKQRTKSNCLLCYNTNFVGGFHNAVETYAQIRQFTHQESTQQPIVQQRTGVSIILTNYPIVKPGDIVMQPDENQRWKIASVEPTRLGGSLVHQNTVAELIDKDQVEYKIEIENFDVFRPNYPDMLMHPRTTL